MNDQEIASKVPSVTSVPAAFQVFAQFNSGFWS